MEKKKLWNEKFSKGKIFVERITTIAQTLRKNKINALKFIQKAVVNYYSSTLLINPVMGY